MSERMQTQPELGVSGSDRAVIFIFFVVGALGAHFTGLVLPGQLSLRALYGGLMLTVSLLSLSILGTVTIPVFALTMGALIERSAVMWLDAWQSRGSPAAREMLCALALVPCFFLASTHAMAASASVLAAVGRGSATARSAFCQELAVAVFFTVLGLMAVFYFY